MLTDINPKLPMRDKDTTRDFYLDKLGFQEFGTGDYTGYLMVEKDNVQIHFFEFRELDPKENYGQVYIRSNDIDRLYQSMLDNKLSIHPNGHLETKPWGQREFAMLDPDNNLLTFGQNIENIGGARIKKMSPQLVVTNIERSMEFYGNKLGFDVDFRYENFYAGIAKDGYSIHLKEGTPSIEERKKKKDNEELDIVFSVENIHELYKEYSNKSVEFIQSLREMPYGKEFYVTDPDGYIIAFLEEV
jgi:catechol 2,3-dioxygenase-like lactoylglutathione lyase family enzyme